MTESDRVPDVLAAAPQDAPPQQEQPSPANTWPQVAPVHGHVYGFQDPAWGNMMVAMTIETWERWFRDAHAMRQRLKELEADKPRIMLPT